MDGQLSKVAGSLNRVGAAVGAASLAAGAGLAWAGKSGLEFEEAMSKVGAVGLKSRDQIMDLEKEALRLGATTKFTATQSANAMEVMARAGFSNQEILGGVGGVLSAAAASGLEIAEVANHVSNALKGMGMEVVDSTTGMNNAARVADVLALASARTNSSIGSLGESLANVAGTASDLKVPFEDVVSAVALLQDTGLDASVAGSALNTMLTNIAAGTGKVSQRAKDAHGNLKSFPELLSIISDEAAKSGGSMDRVAYLADLVGLRGQKAASKLSTLFDSGKVTALTEELNKATGSAEKMANLAMDNTIGSWTLFGSAVDGVRVGLFKLVGNELKGVIDKTTAWIGKNQELIVGGTKQFLQDFVAALPTIVTWLERIGKVLVVFYTFAAAVKIASTAMVVFNALMAVNPFVLLTYAIVAAVGLIWAFWPEISEFFSKLWTGIKEVSGKVWEAITSMASSVADTVGGFFSGIWETVKPFFVGLTEYIVGLFVILAYPIKLWAETWLSIIRHVIDAVIIVARPLGEFFGMLWDGISAVASYFWDGIVAMISNKWEQIKALAQMAYSVFTTIWEPLSTFFGMLWDSIAASFMGIFEGIWNNIQLLMDGASWVIDKVRGVGREAMGSSDPEAMGAAVTSPQERVSRSFSESVSKTSSELTIKDQTGRASFTKPPAPGMYLEPTGAF